jgi:hypothetical protein
MVKVGGGIGQPVGGIALIEIEKLSISNIASIYRSCGVNIYIYVQGLRVGFSMSDYS